MCLLFLRDDRKSVAIILGFLRQWAMMRHYPMHETLFTVFQPKWIVLLIYVAPSVVD